MVGQLESRSLKWLPQLAFSTALSRSFPQLINRVINRFIR